MSEYVDVDVQAVDDFLEAFKNLSFDEQDETSTLVSPVEETTTANSPVETSTLVSPVEETTTANSPVETSTLVSPVEETTTTQLEVNEVSVDPDVSRADASNDLSKLPTKRGSSGLWLLVAFAIFVTFAACSNFIMDSPYTTTSKKLLVLVV